MPDGVSVHAGRKQLKAPLDAFCITLFEVVRTQPRKRNWNISDSIDALFARQRWAFLSTPGA
jgi:hypothetical protein